MKDFHQKLQILLQETKTFTQGLKYPHRQEIKIMKKDGSRRYITTKDNITTTYIEQKHKNTGTSVLIHPGNVEKQYIFKSLFWTFS